MARRLTTNSQIDAFIQKVTADALHHAQGVAGIIGPFEQAVRACLNLAIDTVKVMERNGVLGRTCWIVIGGNRWAFSYSHQSRAIELRLGSTQGPVRFRFDNSTTPASLAEQVACL
ncbi:hypothetical protein [Sandaracinobacteroides hominis]|uniref:hypothetical protein n=1 Tax=Sandaracinobacteroides hominis TaxID=2780086 RepID=UPI0018F4415A|nr:hypothetical protein [Sandaracinobacteroides hominis]